VTLKQKLYIVVQQLLGSMILNFFINFGLGYEGYHTAGNESIAVWTPPKPIAGQIFVETFLQSALTWTIAGALVRLDVKRGKVEKLAVKLPYIPENMQTQDLFTCNQTVPQFFKKLCLALRDGCKFAGFCLLVFALPTLLIITILSFAGKVVFTGWGVIWLSAIYAVVLSITTPIPALCSMSHGAEEGHNEKTQESEKVEEAQTAIALT